MARSRKIENVLILKSRFQLEDRRVWFGKARLLADRVVLKGWGYSNRILLEDIREIRWAADCLEIECDNGDSIELIIESAALWKYELQARCGLKDASNSLLESGRDVGIADAGGASDEQSDDAETSVKKKEGDEKGDGTPEITSESSYRIQSAYAQDRPGSNGR